MPIPWIIPAIATGVSAISNLIGSRQEAKQARINTNLTIAENKKQAELAWQRDKESIEAMNKYNLPSSQMQRFTDAGLNKNLVYHQGSPGNQTQFSKYNPPNIQYAYKPKFKGSEFDSIKDLPLAVEQIKNLSSVGRINEAKAVMEEALSKYAEEIAVSKKALLWDSSDIKMFERVFKEEEFKRFFYKGGDGKYYLHPDASETFVNSLVAKWLTPTTALEKNQTDIKIKGQLLNNLSIIPWLQPLINFLRLLR